MNIIIINYCINLIEKKQAVSNSIDLDIKDQNSIRLFCRYMLADHWEKNQNKNLKFDDPNKEEELCIFTLKEFLKLHKYYQNSKDEDSKNKFKSLFDESKELVEKKTPLHKVSFSLCTKTKAHNHMGCRLYNGDGGIRTRVQRS